MGGWLALLELFTAAAGTATQIVSVLQKGKADQRAADQNAKIATQNAQIAQEQARREAVQVARENRLRLGKIRAAAGAAGAGQPLDLLEDVASQGELEVQDTLYQGQLKERAYTNEANLETARGKNAKSRSYYGAAGALLSGGQQITGILKRV